MTPRVLLVDDERGILSALERTLRREGYELVTAESGRAALRVLDQGPVDAVVSDHKMPGMSGLELLGEVAVRRPDAARLLLTGWPEEVPGAEVARVGIHSVLPKPWDAPTLKDALREALAERA